jgi:anti-anti-sigma factor
MLTISVEDLGDVIILHCAGRIVRGEETAILCTAVGRYGRNILVDLSQVDALDAAGVGALLALQAAGVYLKLVSPTKPVREILRITNLESVFEFADLPTAQRTDAQTLQAETPATPLHSGIAATALRG